MTIDYAKSMLIASANCIENQCKGIYEDCNENLCDNCDLCYAQGTNKERINLFRNCSEWLEELSRRRVEELFRNTDEKAIRDKAIDDFADKIISLCDDMEFMNRFNKFPATTSLNIAKELKEKR